MTGDFTTSFKAFTKLNSPSYYHLSRTREGIFEILDLFDGPFEIIEQSIIGNVRATYKKINPFMKWIYVNIENQSGPGEDYQWTTYG